MKANLCLLIGVSLPLLPSVATGSSASSCQSNADCSSDYEICSEQILLSNEQSSDAAGSSSENSNNKVCVHKDQFPMHLSEFIFIFFITAVMTLTNIAGSAGGGIIIPIAIGLYKFDTKSAIALSNMTLGTSGIARYAVTLGESHPLRNGKGVVYDYNYASLSLPMAILGVNLGAIVNLMTANEVILAIFLLTTIYCAWMGFSKYRKLRESEK